MPKSQFKSVTHSSRNDISFVQVIELDLNNLLWICFCFINLFIILNNKLVSSKHIIHWTYWQEKFSLALINIIFMQIYIF